MDVFLNLLLYPHQRIRRVQPEVDSLSDAVTRLYGLDLSSLGWTERREGVLARFEGGVHPEMLVRIPSAKLDCAALLLYLRKGGGWGYQLCARGTVEDAFEARPEGSAVPDSISPEQHAARLARRFRGDREKLLAWLTQEVLEEDGFQSQVLENLLAILAPWAQGMTTASLEAKPSRKPALDESDPARNTPERLDQRPPKKEPGPERCLTFLAGVKVLRRGWSFPLSLLYILFPGKRPAPEAVAHQGWTVQELNGILEDFYTGRLERLELDFALNGAGTYVRRLGKTVYHPFRLTLELIREKGRCMCLLLDSQEPTVYRLIADRDTYMNVDIEDLKKTDFHNQTVNEYTVFSQKEIPLFRREIPILLARLDGRDGVLSATARMGVWSCDGLHFSREQHQQHRDIWSLQ